tara:strand:- start:8770 stop:9210 length:441 start_codon:yes stop_codon:yes gene_type:complete
MGLRRKVRRAAKREADAAEKYALGPSEAEVEQEAGRAATQAGAIAQAGAMELQQGLMGGSSAQQPGQTQKALSGFQKGVAQAGAGARLGARDLFEKIYMQKRQNALDRAFQESQFARSNAANLAGSALEAAGGIAQGAASLGMGVS